MDRPPNPVKGVLFDMGSVLIRWRDEWIFRRLCRRYGLPYDRVESAILPLRDQLQGGRISLRTMWGQLAHDLGIPFPRDYRSLWIGMLSEHLEVIPSSVRIAHQLRNVGYVTGVFSNTDATHAALFRWHPELKFLHPWVLSYRIRATKPDLAAYRAAERTLKMRPEEILLIDDRIRNVAGARNAGWSAVHYTTARGLRRSLRPFLAPEGPKTQP
jgi:FMN phosphatase YigB (HAD superfamily)